MLTADPREHASVASILLEEPVWDAGEVATELLSRPDPSASATEAVYRARGTSPRPWSAVCKVLSGAREGHPRWQSSSDPGHWYWWRREEMAYATGLLAKLTGGLRAPRFLNAFGRPAGAVAIWIEDVTAPPASTWTVARYGTCARQLGRAQWALAGELSDDGWLTRDFLAGYLDRHVDVFDGPAAATPAIRAAADLVADRHRLLAVVDAFPTTLSHNDFHALNLFGEDDGDTVAIDWSFVGFGPLPADAGALAADAVLDYGAPVARLAELHTVVEDGFVAGLRDAGWPGEEERLRLAMRLVAGLKFAWVAPVAAEAGDAQLARWEGRYGVAGDQIRADWLAVAEWAVATATEAAATLA